MSTAADDRDPNWSYSGDWLLDGTGNPAIHASTLSQTNQLSAQATFTFTGTQISVFGVVRALPAGFSPPTSTYVVDGGNPVSYIAPNLTTNEGDNILFFASDTLAAAQHLLVITITRVSPEAPYLLDYVTFSPVASATPSKSSANNPPPSTPTPTPSSTPTPTLSPSPTPPASQASTPVASNTPSVSQSPSSAALSASASSPSISASANTMQTILQSESHAPLSSQLSSSSASSSGTSPGGTGTAEGLNGAAARSSNNVGPIVGGVIGGVALLVLIVLCVLYWRRRQRRYAPDAVVDYHPTPTPTPTTQVFPTPGITPYLFSRQQAGTGAQDDNSNPFDSPSDPTSSERADTSELPYTAIIHSKSRSPTRFAPNRYGEMPVSPEPYIATPPDSAYAPSTEPSERVYLRPGPPSSSGHTSSQGSRIGGPRGPRDDVKGSISSSRPLPARPPAQHSDSGMRFGPPRPPPTEVMSEVMTEIPPAYTAS